MNRTSQTIAAILAAATVLAGCTSTGPGPLGPRYQTPIPEGSTLVLNEALNLDRGDARVYMQNGRVMSESVLGGMDRLKPRCSFGLEKQGDEALISTIEPDRFTTGPTRNRAYADNWPREGVQVASLSAVVGVGMNASAEDRGGSLAELTYVLEIPVSSSSQPQVDDFTCTVDRPAHWAGKLGLEAVREAAGNLVTVELAQ